MLQAATASRISVLLLTDIVGSTDQKTRLGLGEYAKRLARHDEIFKRLIGAFPSAEILKDAGDGYFASFATTSDAVRFALLFQRALADEHWAQGEPLRVRVGIHVGEVAEMDQEQTGKPKIVGLAADLVSRITRLARGGQILLTRFAFNEARQFVSALPPLPPGQGRGEGAREAGDGPFELKWIAHGPYLFRGTDEPLDVFEVGIDGIAPLRAPSDAEDARRVVAHGEDETLGWRPAVGLEVPDRPHWELEKRLGEGGFGEVWLARHEKLGARRVFKFCFDADRLRSFKRELTLFRILQESLGDRPDIARIYEVKLDEPPYFLESEYTEGGNLQDWSDMEGGIETIPLTTRIDIVARVADAAAAAHSVGVLHKDIKPSNILISIENGQPRPQLADFGIGIVDRSKMQAQPITMTGFTLTGDESSQTGTRLYVPPEVLVGRPFTVQGDVYALGVLLYQMIVADLERPLAEGWQRDVSDELLREDVAECVDGDPTRRFSSAADLSKRLRSLDHRRQWKRREADERRAVARRRQLARLAGAAAVVLVIGLLAVAALAWREWSMRREAERLRALADQQRLLAEEARQAEAAQRLVAERSRQAEARQRAIADEVGSFLMGMMLSVAPDTGRGRDVKMIDALDVAAKKLDEKRLEPEVEAYLRHTLGQSYRALGEIQLSEPHASRAVEMIQKIKGDDHPDTHTFRGEYAMVLYELGRFEEAERVLRDVVEQLRRLKGPEDADTLNFLSDHALALLALERNDDAEPIIAQLVEIHARLHGPDHEETLQALSTQAGLFYQRGRYADAIEVFRRVYEGRLRTNGEDHSLTLLAAHNYSSLLYRSGRVDEAVPIMSRVLESQKRAVGPEHPRTLDAMLNLAQMLKAKGDRDGARKLLQEMFDIRTRKLGPEHPDTLHAAGMLGSMLAGDGSAAEAELLLRQTLQLQRRLLPPDATDVINTASALALALENQSKLDDAVAVAREALADSVRIRGADHTSNLQPLLLLGRCLTKSKQFSEAEDVLLRGLKLAQAPAAPNPKVAANFADQLVALYDAWSNPQQAQAHRALAKDLRATTQPASRQPVTTSAEK